MLVDSGLARVHVTQPHSQTDPRDALPRDVLVDGGLARVHLAQQDMASADLRHSHAVDLHADAVAVQRRVYLLDVRQTCARQLRKLSVYLYIE